MADEAIIEAQYTEWKMVKTRKALQLVFEVPLEHQALVQSALGTPLPDVSTPVAIVRLLPADQRPPAQIEHHNDDRPSNPTRPLSQVAGALCGLPTFRKFIQEKSEDWAHLPTIDEASDWLRSACSVSSRRDLNTDDEAAARFRKIRAEYQAWMVA